MHNVIIIVKDSLESGSNSALTCIINLSDTDGLFQYYPPGYTAPTYWTTSQQNIQNVSTPEDWG